MVFLQMSLRGKHNMYKTIVFKEVILVIVKN